MQFVQLCAFRRVASGSSAHRMGLAQFATSQKTQNDAGQTFTETNVNKEVDLAESGWIPNLDFEIGHLGGALGTRWTSSGPDGPSSWHTTLCWNCCHAVGDRTLTWQICCISLRLWVHSIGKFRISVGSLGLSNRPPGPGARSFPVEKRTFHRWHLEPPLSQRMLDSVRFCYMESAWTVVKNPNRNQVVTLLSITVWHLIG